MSDILVPGRPAEASIVEGWITRVGSKRLVEYGPRSRRSGKFFHEVNRTKTFPMLSDVLPVLLDQVVVPHEVAPVNALLYLLVEPHRELWLHFELPLLES